MRALCAEKSFAKGLAALIETRPMEAASHFLSAIRIAKEQGVTPDGRYLSYYGLSVAHGHRSPQVARRACEQALSLAPANPTLLLNLGRVHLIAGRRSEALDCFERGLTAAPGHTSLRQALNRSERRSRPLLPWLGRAHWINRSMGRLRGRAFGWGAS